jgi:ribose 5-phosphate isomerase A
MDANQLKQQAAEHAIQYIHSGMIIGLGAGSTAVLALRKIAELLKTGELHDILGIPCSKVIEEEAIQLGIPLTTLEQHPVIEVTIDGADEVDPQLNLIKGGGGALLREKIVAQATKREIIIVDESKLSPALGTHWAVPVEVLIFGHGSQKHFLESIGAQVKVRQKADGSTFFTDQGNYIFDCNFGAMSNPNAIAAQLNGRAGIVEHGLFLGIAADVIVAGADGIRHLQRKG